jgi:thioredoxin reductase
MALAAAGVVVIASQATPRAPGTEGVRAAVLTISGERRQEERSYHKEDGFILSGEEVRCDMSQWPEWRLGREPYRLETSMAGVFVAGDVRKGSVKRLASAVGEGAMVIQYV